MSLFLLQPTSLGRARRPKRVKREREGENGKTEGTIVTTADIYETFTMCRSRTTQSHLLSHLIHQVPLSCFTVEDTEAKTS